jgi:tetratricopeptide (TPR) repeat protein
MKTDGSSLRSTPASAATRWLAPTSILRGYWAVLVPGLAVVLLYIPALAFQLVWDDAIFLRDLPDYRDPAMWLAAIFRPFVLSPNYFRPLALLTYAGELRLGGAIWAFHLTNIALHTANTVLVALLVWRLGVGDNPTPPGSSRRWLPVLLAGLLYGVHPALVEGVAFVSSRFDLLMTGFLLLALLADHALRGRPSRPIMVGIAFLAAALCKEMAVAFTLVLPTWHLATRDDAKTPLKRMWADGDVQVYAGAVIAGLVYLGFRYLGLGYILALGLPGTLPTGTVLQHLLLVGKSIASYAVVTIWPFGTLKPIHFTQLPIPVSDPTAWIALVVDGLILLGLVRWIRRRPSSGWLAAGGAIALLPVVNLIPLQLAGGAYVAERYLAFPLALGVLAVVCRLFLPSAERSGVSSEVGWDGFSWSSGLEALWLVAAVITIQLTLPNWRDDTSLWAWAADRAPYSSTPFTNLALDYANNGQFQLAGNLAQHALDLDPQNAGAWNNLGLALFRQGRYEEAQSAFEKASSIQPDNALYWNNLAGVLREQDRLADAEEILIDQSLRLNPVLPVAHFNLGLVYLRADRPDLALSHLELALRLAPANQAPEIQGIIDTLHEPGPWLNLGDMLLNRGDAEGAKAAFAQADRFGASSADVAVGLSSALIQEQDWANAEKVLTAALQDAPEDARLYYNLGVLAREQGEIEVARERFSRAVELAPTWELPRKGLESLPDSP